MTVKKSIRQAKANPPVTKQAETEPIEKCGICDDPCDPASVSSCSCCDRTICEDCREWSNEESFCPSCHAYLHGCGTCACSLAPDNGGLCGNPDSSAYFGGYGYYRDACEDWKPVTPDSSRDALRRIGPIVAEVRSALRGICETYQGGPGSEGCKGSSYVKNGKKVGCPLWNLCRHMKGIRDWRVEGV